MPVPEYIAGQNDPNQQPLPDVLTLGEALRTIAERTAFRSESERDLVYAALDRIDQADEPDEAEEVDDEEVAEPSGGDSTSAPAVAAKKAAPPRRRNANVQ